MFSWDNPLGTISSPTVLRNCHWWSHFLTKTQEQDYNQQPKTLLYSITDVFRRVFWGLFWNSCTKNFGNYTVNAWSWFYCGWNCAATVSCLLSDQKLYYRLLFLECSETIAKLSLLSLTLVHLKLKVRSSLSASYGFLSAMSPHFAWI